MAIPTQPDPKIPIVDAYESAPLRRDDPYRSFQDITSQSASGKILDADGKVSPSRGLTTTTTGTIVVQGPRDSTGTTIAMNSGVEYGYVIASFTFGTATQLTALR